MTDTLDALERLARLHQSGALTDAEFAEQKARVLRNDAVSRPVYNSSHQDEPAGRGGGGRMLLAGLGAVLLGVLVWWQLVDSDGEVKPVPTPGTVTATGRPATKVAAASSAPTARPVITDPAEMPLAVTTGTAAAPATFNPSFDCTGQDEPTLVMICESRSLSAKDRDLSDRFKAVLRSLDAADREALLRRQRDLLRARRTCIDAACLHEWYDRTLELYL